MAEQMQIDEREISDMKVQLEVITGSLSVLKEIADNMDVADEHKMEILSEILDRRVKELERITGGLGVGT